MPVPPWGSPRGCAVRPSGEADAAFLVERRPTYVGTHFSDLSVDIALWARLDDVVRTGAPAAEETLDLPDNPLWHELAPWLAPQCVPVATAAAAEIGIADAG